MKKMLLLAAAAMMGTAAMAQISVTKASDNPFTFSSDNDYYTLYLDAATADQAKETVPEENFIYIGPDDNTRFLYVWESSVNFIDPVGTNSFGSTGGYQTVEPVADWIGMGYFTSGTDLTKIDNDYTFHMALKSVDTEGVKFQFILSQADDFKEAALVAGETEGFEFERDGEWYNIDIPVSTLNDMFGFDLTQKTFAGNILSINTVVPAGTQLSYDAVMFYGPHKSEPVNGISSVKTENNVNAPVYNLAGQRVSKNYKGVAIQNGKKFIVK